MKLMNYLKVRAATVIVVMSLLANFSLASAQEQLGKVSDRKSVV